MGTQQADMKVIAYAHFAPDGQLELRRNPATGFKPLVFADTKVKAKPSPEEIAKLAAAMGWRPPLDREQAIRDYLEGKPLGVTKKELQAIAGLKQILRALGPMRAAGEVTCMPPKGTGARWYLTKYHETVEKARQEALDAQKQRDRKQALDRYYKKQLINCVWALGAQEP
jgi:hypothetical protein